MRHDNIDGGAGTKRESGAGATHRRGSGKKQVFGDAERQDQHGQRKRDTSNAQGRDRVRADARTGSGGLRQVSRDKSYVARPPSAPPDPRGRAGARRGAPHGRGGTAAVRVPLRKRPRRRRMRDTWEKRPVEPARSRDRSADTPGQSRNVTSASGMRSQAADSGRDGMDDLFEVRYGLTARSGASDAGRGRRRPDNRRDTTSGTDRPFGHRRRGLRMAARSQERSPQARRERRRSRDGRENACDREREPGAATATARAMPARRRRRRRRGRPRTNARAPPTRQATPTWNGGATQRRRDDNDSRADGRQLPDSFNQSQADFEGTVRRGATRRRQRRPERRDERARAPTERPRHRRRHPPRRRGETLHETEDHGNGGRLPQRRGDPTARPRNRTPCGP